MALDLDCKTTEYYIGDGRQTDYQFYFELIEGTDLRVGIYNFNTNEYEETTDWTRPDSTSIVRFAEPPANGDKIVIYRLTSIEPLKAIFHPGHPVKAGDLNDNFEQLQFAIEDTRCFIEGGGGGGGSDVEGITTKDQKTNKWISDDEHFAYTGALSERYDVVFLDDGDSSPRPGFEEIIQPGKFMITTDNNLYAWSGTEWFQPIAGGVSSNKATVHVSADPPSSPQQGDLWWSTVIANLFIWYVDGDSGQWVDASVTTEETGQHTTITSVNPITNSYTDATNSYSIGFDINSLEITPDLIRIRR